MPTVEEARGLWDPAGVYLNTARYGLPPCPGWEALQAALEDWRGGRTSFGPPLRLIGLQPGNSAIVTANVPGGAERLEEAGIVAAVRGGRLRASWHVYNTEADVDAALDALAA